MASKDSACRVARRSSAVDGDPYQPGRAERGRGLGYHRGHSFCRRSGIDPAVGTLLHVRHSIPGARHRGAGSAAAVCKHPRHQLRTPTATPKPSTRPSPQLPQTPPSTTSLTSSVAPAITPTRTCSAGSSASRVTEPTSGTSGSGTGPPPVPTCSGLLVVVWSTPPVTPLAPGRPQISPPRRR